MPMARHENDDDVMANMRDYGIIVIEIELLSFTFGLIILGNV